MNFSEEDVRTVAGLARLEFDDAQAAEMAQQLDKIVGYVQLIQEAPVDDLEPFIYPTALENIHRSDEVGESLPVADVLANCDKADGQFFNVPPVIE